MQKVKTIFKIYFKYDSLTPDSKESSLFTWLNQNGTTNLLWVKDNYTMFANKQCKGIFKKIYISFAVT